MAVGAVLADAGNSFAHAATGDLLLAIPVAALAGLVSFLSPCVLPLVPAYLSYVTGLSGAELAAGRSDAEQRVSDGPGAAVAHAARLPQAPAGRGRVLLGSVLFVAGFSLVLIPFGASFGELGAHLVAHQVLLDRIAGGVTIVMGLAFAGLLPLLQREWRMRLPAVGIGAAPLVGLAFGVGWTPCTGPTLGAVIGLAATPGSGATAARGAVLVAAYCAGLGLPFIAAGLAFRRAMTAFDVVKRHYRVVVGIGGLLLVTLGVLLVSGEWTTVLQALRAHLPGYTAPI